MILMDRTRDVLKTEGRVNMGGRDFNDDAFDIASRCWLRLQVYYFNKKNAPNREEQLRNDKAAASLMNNLKRRREILKTRRELFSEGETEKLVNKQTPIHMRTIRHIQTIKRTSKLQELEHNNWYLVLFYFSYYYADIQTKTLSHKCTYKKHETQSTSLIQAQ